MTKLYFITRSYLPSQTGGVLIRKAQVDFFEKNGLPVTIVTPDYEKPMLGDQDNIVRVPISYSLKVGNILERVGLWQDYLDPWVEKSFQRLESMKDHGAILFATSGGELGCIKLAYRLKKEWGCKMIVNFQDPLDYSIVNGIKLDNRFHVSREMLEFKYLSAADLIVTSSNSNRKSLAGKYPELKDKIINLYYGFIKAINNETREKIDNKRQKITVAYGGIFGWEQTPELLAIAAAGLTGVRTLFIGRYKNYKPIRRYLNQCEFIELLPRHEYLQLMQKEVDIGFVSLANDYLGACFPSKIFEYINLGIPILGALPDGDAKDVINDRGYGIACHYKDIDALRKGLLKLNDHEFRRLCVENIMRDRAQWSMESQYQPILGQFRKFDPTR